MNEGQKGDVSKGEIRKVLTEVMEEVDEGFQERENKEGC